MRRFPYETLVKFYTALTQPDNLSRDDYVIGTIGSAAAEAGLSGSNGHQAMEHLERLECVEVFRRKGSNRANQHSLIKILKRIPSEEEFDRYLDEQKRIRYGSK